MNASDRAKSDHGDTAHPPQNSPTASGLSNTVPTQPPPANVRQPFFNTAQYPYGVQPYGFHPQAQQAYYRWYQYQAWMQYWQRIAQPGGPQPPMLAPGQQSAGIPGAAMNAAVQSFAPSALPGQAMSATQPKDGTPTANLPSSRKKKHKDPKIMLPAQQPSDAYLNQAKEAPEVVDPSDMKLVILDLNGTLLHRPDARNRPKLMVGRPYLPQFLQYLFDNFAVMIWSSAKPQNVKSLVENGLGDHRSLLIAEWARDTLGLAPHHYDKNVQCYKNLDRVWASDEIQCSMLGYEEGKRFDQRNTILIDDSALKASAQLHNLLEIPEFTGAIDTKQDILGEVAGYLELLKMQEDVSKFIHKNPFKADGTWKYDWGNTTPDVNEGGSKDGTLEPVILGNE